MQLPAYFVVYFARVKQLFYQHWQVVVCSLLLAAGALLYSVPSLRSSVMRQLSPAAAQANLSSVSSAEPPSTPPGVADVSAKLDAQQKNSATTTASLQDLTVQLKNAMVEISRLTALLNQNLEIQRTTTQPISADATENVAPIQAPAAATHSSSTSTKTDSIGVVHINSANLAQLEALPGIGASYGKRIIDYRSSHAGFKSIDELVNVKGIGQARLAKIRQYLLL